MYGKTATFLVEFEIQTLRTALELNMNLDEAQKQRLNQLNKLDEKQLVALHHTAIVQQQHTKWHDRFIKMKVFQKDDWALLYDSRFKYFKGKHHTRWLGP